MKNSEYPFLIAQDGPLSGMRWLIKTQLFIGRDSSCEIAVPDRQVSRQHARVVFSETGVVLEDLGSKNGTFCNSKRLEGSVELKEGDEIQIAMAQQFLFISPEATLPLEDMPFSISTERRLKLDMAGRRVYILNKELDPPLSFSQFSLLQLLYQKSGEVVSRTELASSVWGGEIEFISEQALDALIRRLRERLAQLDSGYEYIITVRGHGLRLENPLIN